MLPALEDSLKKWLQQELSFTAETGDVSFRTPDDTWGASVSRLTVNLFLHEVVVGTGPRGQLAPFMNSTGTAMRTPPAPRVSFSYLVSAWAGEVRDEHQLVGDILRVMANTVRLPDEHVAPGLIRPVDLALGDSSVGRTKDVWNGVGGRLRPALCLVATMILPVGKARPLEPAVTSVEGGVGPAPVLPGRGAAVGRETPGSVGQQVRPGCGETAPRRGPWLSRLRRGDRITQVPPAPPTPRTGAADERSGEGCGPDGAEPDGAEPDGAEPDGAGR